MEETWHVEKLSTLRKLVRGEIWYGEKLAAFKSWFGWKHGEGRNGREKKRARREAKTRKKKNGHGHIFALP